MLTGNVVEFGERDLQQYRTIIDNRINLFLGPFTLTIFFHLAL